MSENLEALIERARSHKMTPAERFEQRVSFVYSGVCETTTREEVRARLAEEYGDPVAYEARIAHLEAENARLTALVQQLGENAATAAREYAEGMEGLRAERDALANAIADPNAVHVNLLRGSIARPTVHQMIHIYSPAKVRDALDVYARQALKGADHGR
jgi:hypothetical protein